MRIARGERGIWQRRYWELSKRGPAAVRKALYMPALVARKRNPIIQAFCQRLARAGKTPMQQIGAAMRKLLHLIFGVVKSGRPFDPNYTPLS